jgi:hypothetical protein
MESSYATGYRLFVKKSCYAKCYKGLIRFIQDPFPRSPTHGLIVIHLTHK